MKKYIYTFLLSFLVSFGLIAANGMSALVVDDNLEMYTYGAQSYNSIKWTNGTDVYSFMYGTGDGTFYLHGGAFGSSGSFKIIPGDIDTQYVAINPWSNTTGVKFYNTHTNIENSLIVTNTIYASNFTGSSSGTNTGDQTIKNTLGVNLNGLTVPANTTKYAGIFATDFAPNQLIAGTPMSYSGIIRNLMINLGSAQVGTMKVMVYVNGAPRITITITDSGTTRVYGNISETYSVVRGSMVYFAFENQSSSTSAQIGGITFELTQN